MSRSGRIIRGAASSLAVGALTFGSALALGTAAGAAPGDGVALTVSQDAGLESGQTISVTGEGLDPAAGYYLSTCVIGTDGPTGPDCAGGPTDEAASVWVSNDPSATAPINPDGTFTASLTVTQSGLSMTQQPIDCEEDLCAVTLFNDHRNGFGLVTGTPVTFSAAPAAGATTAPAETTETVVEEEVVETADESSSNTVWWILGGVIVVAAVAGGAVAYSKKS